MLARCAGSSQELLVHTQRSLERRFRHVLIGQTRAFGSPSNLQAKLQVGDRVLLRWKQGKTSKRKLTQPLRDDGETPVDNHKIKHADVIGQDSDVRLTSVSKDGLKKLNVFARHPTLDDFTSLSPRRVAPIYATYASTIVSLLDIHVDPPTDENEPHNGQSQFQILEAGTGHGSLTLQLARAIAAANPAPTAAIKPLASRTTVYKAGEEVDSDVTQPHSDAFTSWKSKRRAVVHTVDIDPLNREHAERLIRSFRNALYWPHIDFYAGNVKDWVEKKLAETEANPFLDIVLLDMPGVEQHVTSTVNAIKDGGQLLVFAPQITQIATCVQEIVTKDLDLKLEKVVELGDGISNGRLWDVRMASLRNSRGLKNTNDETDGTDATTSVTEEAESTLPIVGTIPPMVCRPMVGELTRGGGFIAIWKRMVNSNLYSA